MKLINITFENGKQAFFKSSNLALEEYTTDMINPAVLRGKDVQTCNALEHFGVKSCIETYLDGRTSFAKNIPYFSFTYCFKNLKNSTQS